MKKAIREGTVAVGTALGEFATRGVPKILEYAGLDWVMIDMEHSGFTMDKVADLIAWFKSTPITIVVRPPANLPHFLAGAMAAGAMGVQVAQIEDAQDAKAAVDAVMYPPIGNRGVGLNWAHSDFTRPKAKDYLPLRNAETSVIAMIESEKGLNNVEAIAAVEGIDILNPSHNDLSVSLGVPGQYDHPRFREALHRIAAAAKAHGKALKFRPQNDADVDELYALGCRVMSIRDMTSALQDALRSDTEKLRVRVTSCEQSNQVRS